MNKKYELTSETKVVFGVTLYRIRALVSFGIVSAGDVGGFVESEKNLEANGNAWVYGNAQVSGDAKVSGDARVYGNAWVYGNASKSPVLISGLCYQVTITDTHIKIGCEYHAIDDWASFTDSRIRQMDGDHAITFWNEHKSSIMALAESHKIKAEEAA